MSWAAATWDAGPGCAGGPGSVHRRARPSSRARALPPRCSTGRGVDHRNAGCRPTDRRRRARRVVRRQRGRPRPPAGGLRAQPRWGHRGRCEVPARRHLWSRRSRAAATRGLAPPGRRRDIPSRHGATRPAW